MGRIRKFETTFNLLAEIRSLVRGKEGKRIKRFLGDSTNNNRTLTVGQIVRYLSRIGAVGIAGKVSIVNNILEKEVLKARSNRSDAIDIGELVTTYRNVVMKRRKYRKQIGSALSKRG